MRMVLVIVCVLLMLPIFLLTSRSVAIALSLQRVNSSLNCPSALFSFASVPLSISFFSLIEVRMSWCSFSM